ncbi:MAG: hypothetical protein R3B45_18505 [Bdellovibrionota bacterium]
MENINKYRLLIFLLLSSCGGGGGGSGACGPNPINGGFANTGSSKILQLNNCGFSYYEGGCTISGTYPYSETAFGSMNVTVTSSTGCGSLPSTTSCSYAIASSNQIMLNCPAIGINDTFYRL